MRIYRIYKDDTYIGSSRDLPIIKEIVKTIEAEIVPLEIGGENVRIKKDLSDLPADYDYRKLCKKRSGF